MIIDKNMKTKVAKELFFIGKTYTYLRSKSNILVYISQPNYLYEDWQEDGGILVVKFHPDRLPKDAFEVLHCINSSCCNYGYLRDNDVSSGINRMAIPIYKK